MKITAFVHFSVPYRMAGSETMLHAMLAALAEAGHEVLCVTSDMEAPRTWTWGPVRGIACSDLADGERAVVESRPDVVISHHQNAVPAIRIAKGLGVKSVYIQHNDFPGNGEVLLEKPDLTVFNTQWVAQKWEKKTRQQMVVHPPVWASEHATTPGRSVTLVNMNRDKGSLIFYQMAKRIPQHTFLGVLGSHGPQLVPSDPFAKIHPELEIDNFRSVPDNVEIIGQTTDMKNDVWARTRILVVPSVYESFGMVAVEAMASGIPVIAAPTPGLKESLGIAGTFVGRSQIAGWVYRAKRLLNDEAEWQVASARSLSRSAAMDPRPGLKKFVQVLERMNTASDLRYSK